jgi:site-specific DNA recombinase
MLKKAIGYYRVSTSDQVEFGNSLQSQERVCGEYAKRAGYEIVRIFREEGESAKSIHRTQLKALLDYISKHHKEIDAIIVYKIDRLARNMVDHTGLVSTFSKLGIDLKSATENLDDTPAGKLTMSMIAAIAQFDNDQRSERTKTGMKQAILEGRWCWRSHIGYKQGKGPDGKSLPIPSLDAPFVQEAFRLAETGLYKQVDIVRELKKRGFKKLNEKRLNYVLRNPIYAGLIKVNWFPDPIPAIHQPLVSKETFTKVQFLIDGKRPQIAPNARNHSDFPLRNFIRCHKCDQKMTGGWSTGRQGKKYAHYHCRTRGCSLNASKQQLEGSFYEFLLLIQPSNDILDLFEAIILKTWKEKQSDRIKLEYQLENDLRALLKRKDRIDELLIDRKFDDQTYQTKMEELQNEIAVKQLELNEARIELNDIEACINYCKNFLSNIAKLWLNADVNLKQRLQNLIFPEKIYYENGTFRTTATASIFKRLQGKSPDLSQLVAPTGFEPVFDG